MKYAENTSEQGTIGMSTAANLTILVMIPFNGSGSFLVQLIKQYLKIKSQFLTFTIRNYINFTVYLSSLLPDDEISAE